MLVRCCGPHRASSYPPWPGLLVYTASMQLALTARLSPFLSCLFAEMQELLVELHRMAEAYKHGLSA